MTTVFTESPPTAQNVKPETFFKRRRKRKIEPLIHRLMRQVRIDLATGCWQWLGYRMPSGYGRVGVAGQSRLAHRISYIEFRGQILDGLTLDHVCRNRNCINPWHLEAVSAAVNAMRGDGPCARNARKAYCKKGHALNPTNTYLSEQGRHCRPCRAAASQLLRRRVASACVTLATCLRIQSLLAGSGLMSPSQEE